MGEVTVDSTWVDISDGDILTILEVDGIVLKANSKNEGVCIILAPDLLQHFKPINEVSKSSGVDMVNEPPHYKDESGIECIEVTKHMQFCGGSCFKYLYRCGKKHDDIEDLKKAAKYADWAWENEEIVLITPMRLIEQIAVHREGNIREAMMYIAEDFWAMAKHRIEDEIARLESEANR